MYVPHELPVQIGVVTIVKPPSPGQVIWAASRLPHVVILVSGTEHHVVMVTQRIPGCTIVTDDRDLVTVFFVVYLEHVVMSENSLSTPILQLDSQRRLICCGDTINFVVSQPEILSKVSEAWSIVISFAMEADRCILSPLKHDPSSAVRLQVAIHLKLCFSVRVDVINTTSVVASIKDIIASFHYTNQELNYVLCAKWEGRTKIFSLR